MPRGTGRKPNAKVDVLKRLEEAVGATPGTLVITAEGPNGYVVEYERIRDNRIEKRCDKVKL